MSEFENLLDSLDEIIEDASGLPLSGGKCIVSREQVQDIIQNLRLNLPTEIKKAKATLEERERILQTAKNEAERTIKQAEAKAAVLLDQEVIFKEAQLKAEELIANATNDSNKMRKAAAEYVDNMLKRAEESIASSLSAIKEARKVVNEKPAQAAMGKLPD